ncbi:ArsR family transcriptional regulator [Rhodobacteraceae bacterium RKSG542]|uniref:ArsR/SmtB family transcription factor n=1 Tax=Pseudovibrio flavus TaxID=2529854 RepID=UPI0012BBAD1F|nr:metalloregulator ArsR/SmtB family transcription factor [Pseudovibrio flavus]MTI15744.1 ArsR family transcriptional regulator [Pseudovibrio flavus]
MSLSQCTPTQFEVEFDEEAERQLAAQAKAIAHPVRIRLLKLLAAQKGCIGNDLVEGVGLAQSTVSEHMSILRKAGFVIAESKPPRICYELNRDAFAQFQKSVLALSATTVE